MIEETWEKRWFGKGAMPLMLQQWSEEYDFTAQPVRTDYYLMHSSNKDTGIKWREGEIQIKERIGNSNPNFEHYRKWSFPLKDENNYSLLKKRDEWLGVTKKREMLKFTASPDGIKAIDFNIKADHSCELELTAVLCKDSLWWTIAYEATGSVEILEKVINKFPVPHVMDSEETGYAEWLTKNFKNGH